MNAERAGCAIGLDVGGTKIAAGLVAYPGGAVLARRTVPTRPRRGGEALLSETLGLAEALMAEADGMGLDLLGIGIGVAELVDGEGNVTSAHTLAWRGMGVGAAFSRLAPAVVESDVRAGALAEAMFGAGRSYPLFVYVTVGTGIASALVQDGRPFAGARGNALILASSPLTTTCGACGAEVTPILEEFASGPALVERYNRIGRRRVDRGEALLEAVSRGDPLAREVVGSGGDALGVSVGFLVNVLDPGAVIVGGGLGLAGGIYWDRFMASTRAHIWAEGSRDLPILQAATGADAGLIGAAATVFRNAMGA